MKMMYQKLMDYLDRGKINKKEWGFYLVVIVASALVELSIQNNIAPCTFPLIIFIVLFIFLKYIFPIRSENSTIARR
jgi:hypothetical protein